MDSATKNWMVSHADKLKGEVLEVGSLNVNGGLRDVVNVTVGIDMREGKGVDLVCPIENLKQFYPDGYFDACISAGTLEYVQDWKAFIANTWDAVREGGYLVMTIASLNKGRHNYPNDYWRMTEDQLRTIYPNAEWIGAVGPVSTGWVVKKEGAYSLDIEPIPVG